VAVPTTQKTVEDIIGADDEGQDKTSERCPACGHGEAYFKQLQIRSADEPMSVFYRCTTKECGHRWTDK
jgi:DNA-directed RNA polymerase III subunit RPC11